MKVFTKKNIARISGTRIEDTYSSIIIIKFKKIQLYRQL